MESESFNAITSELQKQRNVVHQRATALRSDLWTVEKHLARIDAALLALSGEATNAGTNGVPAKRPKRTLQSPSAKKTDVIEVMRRLLEKEEVVAADGLKKQVEALLTKGGFNRFGFAMRWKEAIQDPQFIVTEAGMKLRDQASGERSGTATR